MPDPVFDFYACENSYFSAKVRPALRIKGLHVRELLPTPQAYRDVIVPRTGVAFIPVVITPDGEAWQDTSEILDRLEQHVRFPPLYPITPVQRVVSYLVELYADEFLLLPAMHYRWSSAEGEAAARADFAAMSGDRESAERFADRMSGSLRLLGVGPDTIGPIEAHTRDLLAALNAHFAVHPYLLGAQPSLADCALMGPLYGHLRFDPVPQRLLRAEAIPVLQWIERMNHPPARHRDDPEEKMPWLPDDALPPTLRPVLDLIGHDAIALLNDNRLAVEAWLDENGAPGSAPPRVVGLHQTTLRGVECSRYTSPYGLWMWQRPLDAFRSLGKDDEARVRRALADTGIEPLLDSAPRHRVGKRATTLVVDPPAIR